MGVRSKVFRAFVDALTHDPALQAMNVTFNAWEEGDDSHQPPAMRDLPWVRLSPRGEATKLNPNDAIESNLIIHVETMTETNDAVRSMDLWDAIEASILSKGFDDAMAAVGVSRAIPLSSAFGVKPHYRKWEPALQGTIYAECDVELRMFVFAPTRS